MIGEHTDGSLPLCEWNQDNCRKLAEAEWRARVVSEHAEKHLGNLLVIEPRRIRLRAPPR
jgi:hypothetical protein